MDGDDLTGQLADTRCGKVREELRRLGILGLEAAGLRLTATAFIRQANFERTGFTAYVSLRIDNHGDRTARGLKATITHSETGCVVESAHADWQESADGRLNPRALQYRSLLNPGDHSIVMGLPLCERTIFPFSISIRLTADDCPVTELHCKLTAESIARGQPVPFENGIAEKVQVDSNSREISPPTSPAAKKVLEMILAHSPREECGFTEILNNGVSGPLEILCIPNAVQAGGGAFTISKSATRAALKELVQLGWLLPPEEDETYRVYQLNPDAPK